MVRFDIDLYADTVCPWCYIGKRTLDLAMEKHRARYPEDQFHLTWRPFLLFPNAKVSAYNKRDSILFTFGADAPALMERMERAGAAYGLRFNWDGRTGSSRDSHKLILLAADQDAAAAAAAAASPSTSTSTSTSATSSFSSSASAPGSKTTASSDSRASPDSNTNTIAESPPPHGPSCPPMSRSWLTSDDNNNNTTNPEEAMEVDHTATPSSPSRPHTKQEKVMQGLLEGGLACGHDISDRAGFLVPLGLAAGLAPSAAELEAHLDSGAAEARVDAETARARRDVGVGAVPTCVVNGRYRVGGMQEPAVFIALFERIRAAATTKP